MPPPAVLDSSNGVGGVVNRNSEAIPVATVQRQRRIRDSNDDDDDDIFVSRKAIADLLHLPQSKETLNPNHSENAVGDSTVSLGDETVGHLRSYMHIDDDYLSLDDELTLSSSLQAAPSAECSPDLVFVGLENPDALLCAFNSLLQAWFYIAAFRNAVLSSKSQDNSLNQLKTVFHCLQKRRRDICVNVIVFIIVIWI